MAPKKEYVIYPRWREDLAFLGPVTVMESKRRTKSLEVKMEKEGPRVKVRRPLTPFHQAAVKDAEIFVLSKQDWIQYHTNRLLKRMQEAQKAVSQNGEGEFPEKLDQEDLKRLKKEASAYFPKRLAFYAPLVGVTYTGMQIRHQKTRWGSCSSTGVISLNMLLMLMPESVRDYVVVHELCHRKEMNHSPRFWKEVEKVLPNYKKERARLKQLGTLIMSRMEE